MELITKIKNIPKKKLIVVGAVIVLVVATLIITFVAAKRSNDTSVEGDSQGGIQNDNSISVFKPVDESKETTSSTPPADTVEPLDMTGVNGLVYVSQGDGTCYVDGIGSCESTELKIPAYSPYGDKVTRIGDGAFTNCTQLLTVTIPATVKTVGTGAFRGCSGLVSINVDTENSVYCSVGGVLLSKDKTVLVCLPMNRPGSSYLLNTSTKAIAAYAFEGAINLKSLLYEGTISDFQKIDVLMGNGILDKIAITCNYVSAK